MINAIFPNLLEAAVRLQIMALLEMDEGTFARTWSLWTDDTYIAVSGLYDEDVLVASCEGVTAPAFNTLAKAYAALAFAPNGIDVMGQHYEASRGMGIKPVQS